MYSGRDRGNLYSIPIYTSASSNIKSGRRREVYRPIRKLFT